MGHKMTRPIRLAVATSVLLILLAGCQSTDTTGVVRTNEPAKGDYTAFGDTFDGLKTISDSGAIEKIVDEVIAANPKQVEQYKGGKTTVIGFLVGQVMKASRGQANTATVNEILKSKLG